MANQANPIEQALSKITIRLRNRKNVRAIAVRGSYITGLRTPTSDVDLFLIQERKSPSVEQIIIDGIEFHIRCYPPTFFDYMFKGRELRYIGFFKHSRPLWDPVGAYEKYRKQAESLDCNELARFWYPELVHHCTDAEGQMCLGNYATALYILRSGAHLMAQLLLLTTSTPTYKAKDVITILQQSEEIGDYRTDILHILALDHPVKVDVAVLHRQYEVLIKRFYDDKSVNSE